MRNNIAKIAAPRKSKFKSCSSLGDGYTAHGVSGDGIIGEYLLKMLARKGLIGLLEFGETCFNRNLFRLDHKPYLIAFRFKYNERLFEPKPGVGRQYRRDVHYPKEYTIKPIPTTNLAGRDPETGRVVVGTLGGGLKWPYLWVDYKRVVPKGSPPLVERVLEIIVEPNRTGHVALVGHEDKLRYILATENMKKGDVIITSSEVTRSAVRPNEGDAYPVGSLPIGCVISNLEFVPGAGGFFARSAGSYCTILRKLGDSVIIQIPTKSEISVNQECVAVVGRMSNAIHSSIPIGSPNRLRHLGYRPRSGWWQRKTGKHGRKIRPPKALVDYSVKREMIPPAYILTLDNYPQHPPVIRGNVAKYK